MSGDLTERRVEVIARVRYSRCFDALGDTTWEGLDEDERHGWIVGARRDVEYDPATKLLAEAQNVVALWRSGLISGHEGLLQIDALLPRD